MSSSSERARHEHNQSGGDRQRREDIKNARAELVDYFKVEPGAPEEWAYASEIPTEAEVGWIQDGKLLTEPIDIPAAKVEGSYASKDEYLSTQYLLMRADGVLPLARSVDKFRQSSETESNLYRVYEEVFFTSMMVTRAGLALRIEFSATAMGKIVQWTKSKRLRTGSLIALTPASDRFTTKCVPVVVASRVLEDLEVQSPAKPSIWVYVGDTSQVNIDSQQKWIMIECIQGYWEAYRHTLRALQKVRTERFPLAEHLAHLKPNIDAPEYRKESHVMDLSTLSSNDDGLPVIVDVLAKGEWKEIPEPGEPTKDISESLSLLDNSQIQALRQILTKKLAIVQGPPGTGKTFTSVAAIRVLLANMSKGDPPIVIAAQTNHAIDQILRHCAKFEDNFIRIGGYTTDQDVIEPRTLSKLRIQKSGLRSHHSQLASGIRKSVTTQLEELLEPLCSSEAISADVFHAHGLLSNAQRLTINSLVSHWLADGDISQMSLWCENRLTPIANVDKANLQIDQETEEYEDLDEEELEAEDRDADKYEKLYGSQLDLFPGFEDSSQSTTIDDEKIMTLLSENQDMLTVPVQDRSAIYQYLRRKLIEKIAPRVHSLARRCEQAAQQAKIGRWEDDYKLLRSSKIIGLTTTGLSKYRGLLHTLEPKIVLIEEAAEILEPYTAAAIFNSLEHLILVGDHQQLRANCNVIELAGAPVNFDISLFERLVTNNVEFARLTVQRRMRPEIRQLIKHIYPDLTDHPSVSDLKRISGLDGVSLHFFHHSNIESMDESKSKKNDFEGKMIVEFAKYLVWNDVKLEKITVLTFYNGQRKLILDLFRRHALFRTYHVRVCTVDSYQGEENDVILLSLVRNNNHGNIGFLASLNRVCVALSRARLGLFIFGNAKLLAGHAEWEEIIRDLHQREAIRPFLPLHCPIHNVDIDAREPSDLQLLHGGCDTECQTVLSCGHGCPLKCHPARPCQVEDCEEGCQVEEEEKQQEVATTTMTPLDMSSLKSTLLAIVS